jgi:amidase
VARENKLSSRRQFLRTSFVGGVTTAVLPALGGARVIASTSATPAPQVRSFELDELTIADLQEGMKSGRYTARSIVEKYLARIEAIDKQGPAINSVIELNPDALSMADTLDQQRRSGRIRGPLHGIPVLIKDNIDTADKMMTTAGSLALVGARPPRDSAVVARLRSAGAVILGKTNLSEWANIRSSHSTSGWSGRGGLTRNPYALDRNPCGSSSGSGAAVSASLCAVAIGTETDGSIVCPSSANGIVGIKPTVGLVSRAGIVPIAHSQDTAGAMARAVKDAAILLAAITGADPLDPATAAGQSKAPSSYLAALDPNGLKGARIGVARKYFGFSELVDSLMNTALEAMKSQGATLIDPADLATFGKFDENELPVLLYELKADLNAYLSRPGYKSQVRTLEDVIDFNERFKEKEMPYFGQDLFIQSEAKGPLTTKEYVDMLNTNHRLARADGIDALMDKNKLDAIVAPTSGPSCVTDLLNGDHFTGGSSSAAAVAAYPIISVPAGFIDGMPVGISFFGRAWSEATLFKLAYAFEQATNSRQRPQFLPTLPLNPRG